MWDLVINSVLVILGITAVAATIDFLDYLQAKEIAIREAQKNPSKLIVKAVIDNIKSGNISTVDIGLYDNYNTKQVNLEIETKNLSSSIYKGQILFN